MGSKEDAEPAPLIVIDPGKLAATDVATTTARLLGWAAPTVEKTLTDELAVREKVWREEQDVVFDGKTEVGNTVTVVLCAAADETKVRKLVSPSLPLGGIAIALGVPLEGQDGTLLWEDNRWSRVIGDWMIARLAGVASAKVLAAKPKDWKPKSDGTESV